MMSVYIRDVINALTEGVEPIKNTVDRLEYGNPDTIVTGIAVTFLATQEAVEKAKLLGANLIVTHEGIFYSHWDKREMLKNDLVYKKKCKTIEEYQMSIYRIHDHVHRFTPDGITKGLLKKLGWEDYEVKDLRIASILEIPKTSLDKVIKHVEKSLGAEYIRYAGELETLCGRVALLVGNRGGGEVVIPLFEKENPDLIIYGEGPEWETPEYIRDALQQGKQKALIVLGHAESETPGMEYLAHFLKEKFTDIAVHFISQNPVLKIER
jgi:putative NIF3 family GTP cyclohydrolase 1 type 2